MKRADVAIRFIGALRDAFKIIADRPAIGSPRFAYELGIADLRSRKVRHFPFLIFYIEQPDHIDVWRVLHEQRDIANWMTQ